MLDFIKQHKLLFSIILALVGVLAILLQVSPNSRFHAYFANIAQSLTYPLQSITHRFTDVSKDVTQSYLSVGQLREENEKLKREVAALKEEVNTYIEESIQYHRLKVQLEFAEQNPDKKIFAEVIGESIDNFHQILQINRGSHHGIKRNFAVIVKEGVVGRIQSVTPFQSSVQLIIDQRHRFPAIIQRTRAKGMVYGTHEGLELRRIHLRADLKVGDRVVSSGWNGIFPKGLLVGIVSKIDHEEHELFQTALLTPVVDFEKIEGVFVILSSKDLPPQPLFTDEEESEPNKNKLGF